MICITKQPAVQYVTFITMPLIVSFSIDVVEALTRMLSPPVH